MSASVLIVEDDPNIGMALEYIMEREGYRARRVLDGDAALSAVADASPDLILMDVVLSGQSGYDVCQTLRGNRALCRVKIVILTARSGAPEKKKIRALGADLLIQNPCSTRKLVEPVRQLPAEPPPPDG